MDLQTTETELKKRWEYPYKWGRKQNNEYDRKTNFIYRIKSFSELLERIEIDFKEKPDYEDVFYYALNRWYNFKSGRALEKIFCSLPWVIASRNKCDKFIDFKIHGINFDLKTSVYPFLYPATLEYAMEHKENLIKWLYENQSKQGRMHFHNRLFLILHSKEGEHWKLKAELVWLEEIIKEYHSNFDKNNLISLSFRGGSRIYSDIIWGLQ